MVVGMAEVSPEVEGYLFAAQEKAIG